MSNFPNPERPSFASPCDLDELKHQVREKAIAELKEYIEKGGEWHDFYGSLVDRIPEPCLHYSSDVPWTNPPIFEISRSVSKTSTHDAHATSLKYKGTTVYTAVTVTSVTEDTQKERVEVQRKRKPAERKLPKEKRDQWLPYQRPLPDPTPEDAHSEWFIGLYDELHKRIILAKQCKKWEALLHGELKKGEARGSLIEYSPPKSSEIDTPLWVILGGLCLLTIIIGAILL